MCSEESILGLLINSVAERVENTRRTNDKARRIAVMLHRVLRMQKISGQIFSLSISTFPQSSP